MNNRTPSPLKHHARKRFGQNFLNDEGVIDRIVHSIAPKADDNIVEIGPGQGAITAPLVQCCPNLQVIEIDQDLIPILRSQFANLPSFRIYQQDALTFNFASLSQKKPLRIVGNLPYNISTPLLFHLLSFQHQVRDMHFMLQKEVVERLAARPNNKHYGRLSVMAQYYCQVEYLFGVPPECFNPQPKVDSAVVRLTPLTTLPFLAEDKVLFDRVVNLVFQQRRKTLRKSLKQLLSKEAIEVLPVDVNLRPENIAVKTYVDISNYIHRENLHWQ